MPTSHSAELGILQRASPIILITMGMGGGGSIVNYNPHFTGGFTEAQRKVPCQLKVTVQGLKVHFREQCKGQDEAYGSLQKQLGELGGRVGSIVWGTVYLTSTRR